MTKPADNQEGTPAYLSPYHQAVRDFGPSFEATLWASKDKQRGRFEVMAQMCDVTGLVIVDSGCGLGDYAAWMNERKIAYGTYIGVEGVAEMASAARKRAMPRAEIMHEDFVKEAFFAKLAHDRPFDIVVFSGSLNTFEAEAARTIVECAWATARVGVIFNFLSARNGRPEKENTGPARRFDPMPMIDWALERTPNVLFRQDYFQGHDATIGMFRPMKPQLPSGMV